MLVRACVYVILYWSKWWDEVVTESFGSLVELVVVAVGTLSR